MQQPTATDRTDAAIVDDIRFTLDKPILDDVLVTSVAGTVTLHGTVDSWSQRRNIAVVAHEIVGVRRVVNMLAVRAPALAASGVRMAIEDALARRALREARRLDFEIHDGRVTVTGTVGSSGERDAVVGAVVGHSGVRGVNDQLRIAPSSAR